MDLTTDPKRKIAHDMDPYATGIYVRAKSGEKFESVDIGELDKRSLLEWLRSRGGENRWAEDTVGILLGHGHLHEPALSE